MIPAFVDTAIALRILYLLVTPIEKLPAFKLGLIGPNGEILRKAKTQEEKSSTSMLLRLVLRIRSFLSNIPLAQSKLGKFASAYALVRECELKQDYNPSLEQLSESLTRIEEDTDKHFQLLEEVEVFKFLWEDAPANCAGAGVSTDTPTKSSGLAKRKTFEVAPGSFDKFKPGKVRIKRIGSSLNLEDAVDQRVLQAAKSPHNVLVLKDNAGRAKAIKYTKKNPSNLKDLEESTGYDLEVYELHV